MFLVNKRGFSSNSLYDRMRDRISVRKNEVFNLIDVMLERGEVSDELAEKMGLELAEELRAYAEFKFGAAGTELPFWNSDFRIVCEDVVTYVQEMRKVLDGGMSRVRRMVPVEERDVYVVFATGNSFGDELCYRETEFGEREFLLALPELRSLVDYVEDRSIDIDLDEFSRIRLPLDEEGYLVDELLDVKIYHVDRNGVFKKVELV